MSCGCRKAAGARTSPLRSRSRAGCIALHLAEAIRTLELQQTSFIIVLILIAVALIDFVSSKLRFAMIGRRGAMT